jgi:hypothetical protein
MFNGADLPRMAHVTAQIDDMIYTQPVVYEFPQIKVPTLLIIGGKDRTALGRDLVSPAVRDRLGNYPELALQLSCFEVGTLSGGLMSSAPE